jgi:hypothetical protein
VRISGVPDHAQSSAKGRFCARAIDAIASANPFAASMRSPIHRARLVDETTIGPIATGSRVIRLYESERRCVRRAEREQLQLGHRARDQRRFDRQQRARDRRQLDPGDLHAGQVRALALQPIAPSR